jgi:uncharacterized RDD family membrane protein YckC
VNDAPAGPEQPDPQSPAPAQPQQPVPSSGQVPPGGWQQAPVRPDPFAGLYADWWSRAGAFMIDGLILAVPMVILMIVAFIPLFGSIGIATSVDKHGNVDPEAMTAGVTSLVGFFVFLMIAVLVFILLRLLYGAILMQRAGERNGQTWGKQLLNIRTVRANGQPYDFGSGLLRDGIVEYLLFWVGGSFLLYVPTLLDYLWPLWDDQHRCLHDMMVDSRVIRA